jgi:hypothetical protein
MDALGDHEFKDFQDLAPWRELVPVFAEKTQRFKRTPLDIFHVLLHVDSDVLAERIAVEAEQRIAEGLSHQP